MHNYQQLMMMMMMMIKEMDLLRPAEHNAVLGMTIASVVDIHITIVTAAIITITVCCGTFPI